MIKIINPITEKVIDILQEDTFKEIDLKIIKSQIAQKEWFSKSKNDRIKILWEMKNNFQKNSKKLINIINIECGFDKEEIKDILFDVLDGFDHYIDVYKKKNIIKFPINKQTFPKSTCEIKFYPHGVIAQIGAWNYPLWQTMITVIPALLVGNSILFKPSEKATKTGLLISKIINSTKNFPKNLFIPIIGGPKRGKYLIKSNIDAIVYTGNIPTGKKIIKNAKTKPTILELSGNDASIVCSDCDIEQTVTGIVSGAFLHSGEVCDRIKRIYIIKEVADKFIEKSILKILQIENKITPLISQNALKKVHKQVKRTINDGAEILIGGKRMNKKGYYYKPTLLKLKNNNVESVKNEIFGPVVSLLIVDSEKEAIKLANSTEFGLGTSIWTQNFKKAKEIADKCESGMVWINDSNIPLVCGEYFQGWKSTSIPNASDRLSMFMKSKTIISYNSKNIRDWWF